MCACVRASVRAFMRARAETCIRFVCTPCVEYWPTFLRSQMVMVRVRVRERVCVRPCCTLIHHHVLHKSRHIINIKHIVFLAWET